MQPRARTIPPYRELGGAGPRERERTAARQTSRLGAPDRRGAASTTFERHRWWLVALLAFAASKVFSTVLVLLSAKHDGSVPIIGPQHPVTALGSQAPFTAFGSGPVIGARGALSQWDSLWYLSAAQHGYPHHVDTHQLNTTGFFPGLPWLLRLVHDVTGGNWTATGLVVTTILEIVAVVLVAALGRHHFGDRVAERAAILLCAFPGAYVFALIYSEPLLITAAAACLLCLAQRRWVLAGLAAAVAGLTHSTGAILIVVCAWAAARCLWGEGVRDGRRSLLAPALAPLGTVTFLAFLWAWTGSPTTYSETQAHAWGVTTSWTALYGDLAHITHPVYRQETWVGVIFLALAVAALISLGFQVRRRVVPPEWLVYSVGMVAVALTSAHLGALRPRYALVIFPLLIGLAVRLRGWQVAATAAVFAAGLGALAWWTAIYVP